jgi:hypothetical protein
VFIIRAIYGSDSFSYSPTPYFTDVPRYDQQGNEIFYFKHVQKMKELGITSGCTATEFCPSSPPTPNDGGVARNYAAAVFAIRAAQRKAGNPLFFHESAALDTTFETYSPSPWFMDVPATETTIFRYVQKIRDLGVITSSRNCPSGYYCPNDFITRGEFSYYVVRGILDEYPPPSGQSWSEKPKLWSGTKLQGNIGFVPFDDYSSMNAIPSPVGTCTDKLTVRECTRRFVENLRKQGVTELRVIFGVLGAAHSTALDASGQVRTEWLNQVDLFFQDVRALGITHISLNPSLWGQSDDPIQSAVVPDCNWNYGARWFWKTSPVPFVQDGAGYRPDGNYKIGGFVENSYNCAPANPFFIGWDKIYTMLHSMVDRARLRGLSVFELELMSEMNLQDFVVEARYIYDNKHGSDVACEIGGVWQNSRTVFQCFRRILEFSGFPPGGATISVVESRTTNGSDCTSVYGDSARLVKLSAVHAALQGGRIGRTVNDYPGGLECGSGEGTDVQEDLPHSPQGTPGLIDIHSYPCMAIAPDQTLTCDLSKTGTVLSNDFKTFSDAIVSFRFSRWPGAQVVFGETHNNDVLNAPPNQGNMQCPATPLSAPVDMVNGFNQSILRYLGVVFRPFAVLNADRDCVPWPPLWNKGNGPYAVQ